MAADEEILITLKVDTTESAKSLKQLRTEYKEQLKELEGLTVGTKEYVNALSKIGGIKDDIGDLNQTIKTFNPEGKVQAFGNVIGGLASGIQGAVGAMALFGVESEETQKMLLKVQAASALAEGIKGVVGMGDAFTNLKLVSVKALNAIKVGIGATGIGLLVLALGAVVAYWDDIKSAISGVSSEQEKLLENEKASVKASQDKLSFIDSQSNILKQQGKTEKEILKLKEAEASIAISGLEAQISTQESVKKSQVETAERNKSILQNIIRLVSAPLTLLLSGIDAAGKVFGQDWGLEEKFSGGIAKMLFDPEEVASDGDKAIEETKATLNKLKNDRAGFQLAIKAIDKTAEEKAAADKKVIDDKAAADKKVIDDKILASTTQLIEDTKKLKDDEELRLAATEEEKLTILKNRQLAILEEQKKAADIAASTKIIDEKAALESQQAYTDAKLAIDQKYMDDVNTLRTTEAQKIAEQQAAALLKEQELKTAQLELKSTNATTEYEQLVAQGSLGLALSIDLAQQKADAELAVLEDQRARGLISEQKYADDRAKVEEDLQSKKLNAVEGGLNSAQNLSNAFFSFAQAAAGKDAKKQLELKKKQFKVDKAFNLVRATIDGIRSVQSALTTTPPLSYVLAAFNAVMAAGNIAKIASSKFEGETGGGGGGGSADMPSAIAPPSINAPSSSSTSLNADGSVKPSGGQITSRVIVVESDITNKQRQVASMQQNASV